MRFICVWVVAPLFILALLSQLLDGGREDYPFSKWGMYSMAEVSGPAGKISATVESQGTSTNAMTYISRRFIAQLDLRRKVRELIRQGDLSSDQKFRTEKTRAVMNELVFLYFSDDLGEQQALANKDARLVIEWLEWDHLDSKNLFHPDRRIVLYNEEIPIK